MTMNKSPNQTTFASEIGELSVKVPATCSIYISRLSFAFVEGKEPPGATLRSDGRARYALRLPQHCICLALLSWSRVRRPNSLS
jgi:hypothetical protein